MNDTRDFQRESNPARAWFNQGWKDERDSADCKPPAEPHLAIHYWDGRKAFAASAA